MRSLACSARHAPCVLVRLATPAPQGRSAFTMRAPVDTISAPLFPRALPWVNVAGSSGQASIIQRGRPMLVEFWDFCRPNSLRTLPYVKAWHERYGGLGLRVIGVHCPGFDV